MKHQRNQKNTINPQKKTKSDEKSKHKDKLKKHHHESTESIETPTPEKKKHGGFSQTDESIETSKSKKHKNDESSQTKTPKKKHKHDDDSSQTSESETPKSKKHKRDDKSSQTPKSTQASHTQTPQSPGKTSNSPQKSGKKKSTENGLDSTPTFSTVPIQFDFSPKAPALLFDFVQGPPPSNLLTGKTKVWQRTFQNQENEKGDTQFKFEFDSSMMKYSGESSVGAAKNANYFLAIKTGTGQFQVIPAIFFSMHQEAKDPNHKLLPDEDPEGGQLFRVDAFGGAKAKRKLKQVQEGIFTSEMVSQVKSKYLADASDDD